MNMYGGVSQELLPDRKGIETIFQEVSFKYFNRKSLFLVPSISTEPDFLLSELWNTNNDFLSFGALAYYSVPLDRCIFGPFHDKGIIRMISYELAVRSCAMRCQATIAREHLKKSGLLEMINNFYTNFNPTIPQLINRIDKAENMSGNAAFFEKRKNDIELDYKKYGHKPFSEELARKYKLDSVWAERAADFLIFSTVCIMNGELTKELFKINESVDGDEILDDLLGRIGVLGESRESYSRWLREYPMPASSEEINNLIHRLNSVEA